MDQFKRLINLIIIKFEINHNSFSIIAESAIDSDVDTEAATDLSSLRSALQCHHQRDNLASVITQLLRAYRPEVDIGAYERVLKKVGGLLENCDSPRKRLLFSMIPVPKGVPDHKIAEVFNASTGFVKLNLRGNDTSEKALDAGNSPGATMDGSVSASKQNPPCDQDALDSKSSEGHPFRGFAENEISTTIRNHITNKYHAPAGNTANLSQSHYSLRTACQETSSMKTRDNTEIVSDSSRDKAARLLNGVRYGCRKYDGVDAFDRDTEPGMSKVAIDMGRKSERTIEQETIKDSIRKMDDVCWADEDRGDFVDVLETQDADDLLATVRDGLRASLSNFLKRAREGTSVDERSRAESPAFPRTRSYPRAYSSDTACLMSIDRKPATACKVSEKDLDPSSGGLLSKAQKEDVNSEKDGRDEKTNQGSSARVANDSQAKCGSRELSKASELPLSRRNLDRDAEKKVAAQRRESDAKEPIYGRKIRPRPSEVSAENNFQVHSMSELAAYKKQYYDTLLSVRRAKGLLKLHCIYVQGERKRPQKTPIALNSVAVAVTNSLASSSAASSSSSLSLDRLTAYDDPYYSNYTCQQQHLFQQQRQFATMRPQFSPTCPTPLSGLTSVQQQHGNQQYSWARSDCKYLLLKQLRLRRQQYVPPPNVNKTRKSVLAQDRLLLQYNEHTFKVYEPIRIIQ
ncbi:PREDICTED: uncharacterized protein LOC106743049 [Dinoponera quadriceps]|uniref:Uncharacterized protein LOC106743049 n=1 Tax=Dinoponera quadriceps TaxID=609295 RepID=A0A6P3X151_DINQU|nr:PREDICTED: uncharacterized protein LOC106743049 [Dinoponera quadriceps]